MVRVATCVPKQLYIQQQKLDWLNKAIHDNPCDIFLTSQEFFGGGSIREIVRAKGIETDDFPVAQDWLDTEIGAMAQKRQTAIGIGASVNRDGVITEDFVYYNKAGIYVGHHSKIALPMQDNVALNGASHITPETDYARAVNPVIMADLGLRIGTVFCWQVFFIEFWNDLMRAGVNLCVHPIKFAPRAWYKKGQDANGENVRTGFTQNKGSELAEDDSLGWIRKLRFESEFKQLPIAVTCNTWDGGEKYLALEGWIEAIRGVENLHHLPSVSSTEIVTVTEYEPKLYNALSNLNDGDYGKFKADWPLLAAKTMSRKAVKIEGKTIAGNQTKLERYQRKPEVSAGQKGQQSILE